MKEGSLARRVEPRWPVVLAVLGMMILLVTLPQRVRALPIWAPVSVVAAVLIPMVGVGLTRGNPWWLRTERAVTLIFCLLTGILNMVSLRFVVRAMVRETVAASGLQLLSSGTAVWVTNILVFSLLYWQMDRGGPDARTHDAGVRPDWQFPQTSAPDDVPPGWRPAYIDYLALGFTTATAFSPTDVLPLTPRAKGLMMVESLTSLVTIAVVASRAVNILGS